MTYPNGRVITSNYTSGLDADISRLSELKDGSTVLEGYSYLGLGTVVVRSHPQPGVDLSFVKLSGESVGDAGDQYTGLDRFGRIVDQRWRAGSTDKDRYQYTYDRNGNRTSRTNVLNTGLNETYTYDSLNQLTSSPVTGTSKSWDYDALGNWDGVTTNGTTQTRTHNRQNEITAVSGATTPVFDAAGNMTTDETGKQYVYDAWNRLVTVKNSGGTTLATFAYDALTRRVSETASSVTTDLYYSVQWQVVEEHVSGTARISYVWSPVYVDAMVARDRDSDNNGSLDERLYVTHDANFNVGALIDTSGAVVERFAYDPFGVVTYLNASFGSISASTVAWKYLHQGGRLNADSGFYSFRYREYSPTLGRWVTMDPILYGSNTNNLFEYNNNSPATNNDPSGLKVTIRCYDGRIGFKHCGIKVYCNGTTISYDGSGAASSSLPKPRRSSPALAGTNEIEYDVDTGGKDCNNVIKCLDIAFERIKQLPYDAIRVNSNTYAYAILQACKLKFKCFKEMTDIACLDKMGNPIYNTKEICSPPLALGWLETKGYKSDILTVWLEYVQSLPS